MSKNVKLTILLFTVAALIAIFPLIAVRGSEFGGADGAAEEVVVSLDPSYTPWTESLLAPPGGETESLLFCLQAGLGAGVLGFGFGYLAARKKFAGKKGRGADERG